MVRYDAEFYAHASSSANLDALSTSSASMISENTAEGDFHSSDYFYVYPNPNSGAFHIKLQDDKSKQTEVRVLDLYGKEIYKDVQKGQGEFRINLPTHEPGIYYISFKTEDGASVTKRLLVD